MQATTIIGLEVHVQLLTRSKLFCGCANRFNPDHPNVQVCPVCLGLPGALPVMNRRAVRLAIETGLALNCDIAKFTKWDRKQYFYPDLPKGYQISQYDLPLCHDGRFEVEVDAETGETATVGIIRAHLEEDAGKNLHDESGRGGESRVDLNRCSTPLLEIVSQPDLRSPRAARRFLEELKLLLTYLGVSDCNMQEGSLRCDANVNLHIHDEDEGKIATPIVEIKNLNSFRGVEAALEYEEKRQLDEWQRSRNRLGEVPKQTRGWDAERSVTFAQRGKEEASDYRYFPDPDLVPVTVSDKLIEEIRAGMGELPAARRERFCTAFGLSNYDASVIIEQGPALADYFEQVAVECGDGKTAANWVTQDVLRELNERQTSIDEFPVRPDLLASLLKRIVGGGITTKSAREVFAALLDEAAHGKEVAKKRIDELIDERGLALVSDAGELESVIEAVMADEKNREALEAFRGGKQQALGPLIGQVMRQARGADPRMVRELLARKAAAT